MNHKTLWTRLAAALLLGAALLALVTGGPSQAGKPGGGGGGSVPPGRIYYSQSQVMDTPWGPFFGFVGYSSMLADGSNKTAVPEYPWGGEPNRDRSANGSWILSVEAVSGSYPNGVGREELFATLEGTNVKLQLTDDPAVQPEVFNIRWAHDDSFISFAAITWTEVASGGNYTDGSGRHWQAAAVVFVAVIDWSLGVPAAGPLVHVLDAGLYFETISAFDLFRPRPDVRVLDWSPAGNRIVFDQVINDQPGFVEPHNVFVVTFDAAGGITNVVPLGPGRTPEWSPDGGRIAYWRSDSGGSNIWLVNPDGTGAVQLTSGGTGGPDRDPRWSPDSQHVAFTRFFNNKKRGTSGSLTVTTFAVMRVPAAGGNPVNLTSDLPAGNSAEAAAWR
jgi:dipeptidyl aminopeptidase/acylaminoacyl peptidase